ncbi:threonine--tRNA ligase [Thermoproteota archaeon]
MRILQLHSDFIEYKPTHKEITSAEEIELTSKRLEDIVVVFTCIEKGDDNETANQSITELTESLKIIGSNRIIIYPYAHLSTNLASPKEALQILKEMEKKANEIGLKVHRAPFGWTKAFTIKVKGHPLAEQSKVIQTNSSEIKEPVSKALKDEEKLKSKWYIFSPDGILTNIENYKFTTKSNLEKLKSYEISKSRTTQKTPPHVTLMKRLMIADYEPGSDSGNMRFYPKGRLIKSLLENYVNQKIREYGGIEVETPIMYDINHPSMASYLNRFPARQYIVKSEDKDLFLRFSACFGQFLMAKDIQLSYKHLPFKLYELTRYSFRREKSGEVSGLRRLRAFTMPDCHAMCENLDQAKDEVLKRFKLSTEVLEGIGFTKEDYQLAIRFTKQFYDENKEFLTSIISNFNKPCLAEVWDERFFYFVFKWEFNFIDNFGKASSLSTDQIDVENAERYGIVYTDENDKKQHPIILHNSPSGAIERCIYALLEKAFRIQMLGKSPYLPLWLSPTQVRLIPLNSKYQKYAEKIATELTEKFVRADIDDRDESIGKRIRFGEQDWVPYIAVVGEKEVSSNILYIRERKSGSMKNMTLQELIKEIKNNTKDRPFQYLSLPRNISKHPQFPS